MKHISILIVEDSIYSSDLNVREIKKAGFEVKSQRVSSEKAMLKALEEKKWDIILSDNSMPNFNALRALDTRNKAAGKTPFIIVSEDVPKSDILKAMENGCAAYVSKENLSELREVVKQII